MTRGELYGENAYDEWLKRMDGHADNGGHCTENCPTCGIFACFVSWQNSEATDEDMLDY